MPDVVISKNSNNLFVNFCLLSDSHYLYNNVIYVHWLVVCLQNFVEKKLSRNSAWKDASHSLSWRKPNGSTVGVIVEQSNKFSANAQHEDEGTNITKIFWTNKAWFRFSRVIDTITQSFYKWQKKQYST
jgi:hypothetical protein